DGMPLDGFELGGSALGGVALDFELQDGVLAAASVCEPEEVAGVHPDADGVLAAAVDDAGDITLSTGLAGFALSVAVSDLNLEGLQFHGAGASNRDLSKQDANGFFV